MLKQLQFMSNSNLGEVVYFIDTQHEVFLHFPHSLLPRRFVSKEAYINFT